ncbi:MAG: hypothetical protein IJE18_06320 [Bacteroidaceae bacterium]|nr:hypothetical protein [Bacteroidaceae bacterium]MBQ3196550.1 hypothetical protein [Alistipes sp.]
MLYECTITQADNDKQYLVEADSYAQAESRFNEFAQANIAGSYVLTSISRSHSKLSIANDSKVVNLQDITPQQRRIGFNAVNLDRMVMTEHPTFTQSDIIIHF